MQAFLTRIMSGRIHVIAWTAFTAALDAFVPPRKDHNRHIEMGYQLGIEWTTVVPESDRQSVRAKARFQSRR